MASKRPKKPKSLYTFLKPRLRRASMYWSGKKEARAAARVDVQEGYYKNGNPKFVKKFICAECERQGLKRTHLEWETQMDHVTPVVDVNEVEFDGNWTRYITALFCPPEGYQCLCKEHHEAKTQSENLQRVFFKKKKEKKPSKINRFTKPKIKSSKKRKKS